MNQEHYQHREPHSPKSSTKQGLSFSLHEDKIESVREHLLKLSSDSIEVIKISESAASGHISIANHMAHQVGQGFGLSVPGLHLYGHCAGPAGRSEGFFVIAGSVYCGLGLFQREGEVFAHLIAPVGDNMSDLQPLIEGIEQSGLVSRIYVRHITETLARCFDNLGFNDVNGKTAWCDEAPLEDETFCSRIVDLSSEPSKRFRLAGNRFSNFLARSHLSYELREMQEEDEGIAMKIVERHFHTLEEAGKAIGSCAADYQLLLEEGYKYGPSYLGILSSSDGIEYPVSVFVGATNGLREQSGSLYCTITERNAERIKQTFSLCDEQMKGASAISSYGFLQVFKTLCDLGWQEVDLGGSETKQLDTFKSKLGAKEHQTTWRVKDCIGAQAGALPPDHPRWMKENLKLLDKVRAHRSSYIEKFIALSIQVDPDVFSPKYYADSVWFAEVLPQIVGSNRMLEMGTGTGIVGIACALNGAQIELTDVNPAACTCALVNAKMHALEIPIYTGDLFVPIPEGSKYDFIFWNHPFNRANEPVQDPLSKAIFDYDYRDLARYFREGPALLNNPKRGLLLGTSNQADLHAVTDIAGNAGYQLKLLKHTIMPLGLGARATNDFRLYELVR